jgi:hypothetical protein
MRKAIKFNQDGFEPISCGCIIIVVFIIILAIIAGARNKQESLGIITEQDISSKDIILTERTEKPIGTERRIIDNSKGDVSITREIKVTNEWTKESSVDSENAISTKVDVKKSLLVISAAAEAEVATKFSASSSEGEKRTFSDSFIVNVPARKSLVLLLEWKQVWQHGKVKIFTSDGKEVLVPFSVLQNLTYDSKSL